LMFVFWRWRRRWQAAPCVRELDGTRGPGRGGASRSGAHLVDLDDVAFRVVEEDLLPAAHRPVAVVGISNAVGLEVALESLDVVGAERDVAALERVERLAGAKADVQIPLGEMHLGSAVGDKGDVARVALAGHPA